jgi:uncharacterized protein YbjT (DUF2867 family)
VKTGELHVVTGAFGYTGNAIARRLLSDGKRVRTLVRNPRRLNPFGDRVSVAAYRFDDPTALAESLRGAAVLYNTYWIRFPYGGVKFEDAIANTTVLLRGCELAGVPRIVHLSVTNASEESPLPYYRGKGTVERLIRESSLSYAILRPALIFGEGDILVNNIAWFLRHLPVFAVMGDGAYKLQVVHVDDVADVAAEAAGSSENLVADIVGPETITFEGLVRLIARKIGHRSRIVHVPVGIVRPLLGLAGAVLRDVVLTPDEITGLMADLLVSSASPLGQRRLADWLDVHGAHLGTRYASELSRHYR